MVVRIMEDNQYRLDDTLLPEIERFDGILHQSVEANDNQIFFTTLQEVQDFVRSYGTQVPDDEVVSSNIVLPATDMTLEEVKRYLAVDPAY